MPHGEQPDGIFYSFSSGYASMADPPCVLIDSASKTCAIGALIQEADIPSSKLLRSERCFAGVCVQGPAL